MNKKIVLLIFFIFLILTAGDAFPESLKKNVMKKISGTEKGAPEMVELGKMLFFDRRLSGDGTISCATCHNPDEGFSDGQRLSFSYPTTKNLRNTPTLYNIGSSTSFFWDGRVSVLEEQALFPIQSPFEMNQNIDFLVEKLKAVPEYKERFNKVFGGEVSPENIGMALSAFEKTIVVNDTPYDRYIKGDKGALSDRARRGLELFQGKGGCVKCHPAPDFSDYKFHATGVPEPAYTKDTERLISRRYFFKSIGYKDITETEDLGRYFLTGRREDYKAFKTPTLKNITKTAPYMHNGVFSTLDEVVEFYNTGGGNIPGKDESLKPLKLSKEEKENLAEFLKSLTAEFKIKIPEIP